MLFYTVSLQVDFLISKMNFPPGTIVSGAECTEVFPSPVLEKVYTSITTMIQYLFPLVTVSVIIISLFFL